MLAIKECFYNKSVPTVEIPTSVAILRDLIILYIVNETTDEQITILGRDTLTLIKHSNIYQDCLFRNLYETFIGS